MLRVVPRVLIGPGANQDVVPLTPAALVGKPEGSGGVGGCREVWTKDRCLNAREEAVGYTSRTEVRVAPSERKCTSEPLALQAYLNESTGKPCGT